ncbi:phage gp6-like head-tail connector protein [Rhizobium laguerreae]|uniref:head-tail connector protein n=1 Tax=Rhizobium laguerreae TaxID=1076926 RepID=UPI001C910B92|nr:head-tail connector protein [Rhizobium laguerreae]MBY3543666.1 phage gp6-like head-tail connector protein [Rhizobium laguerreae]
MDLRLVTAVAPILTTADAKAHLRVLHDDDNTYIDGLIAVAGDWLFGENSWIGRPAPASEWEMTMASFPVGCLDIPKPPLVTVDGVFYTPADGGAEREITDFRTFGVGGNGYILPAIDTVWPETDGEPESVRIEFTAGYAALPASIKHAALLLIGHWYENREAATEAKLSDLPMAVDALLMPYRNWPS